MASAETLDKHHNYDEMLEIMQSVANRCSSITMLYNLSSLSDEPPNTKIIIFILIVYKVK